MLVLSRKTGERIVIDNFITIEVVETQGNRVRIGIQAPREVLIHRHELLLRDAGKARRREGNARLMG